MPATAVNLNAPLDLTDANAAAFLDEIQGNILKAHARDHARHLLCRFGPDASACRAWIANFAQTTVTSATAQRVQIATYKAGSDSGEFAVIALSNSGFEALDLASARPADPIFRGGMKSSALTATDPPVVQWETPYQGDIHALIILADQDVARLSRAVSAVQASLAP